MSTVRFHERTLTSAVRRGIWAVTALAVPGSVLGAPTGGQVVAGTAAIAQAGTKTTITQSTAKGAINWQSFSIGTNEYVQFVQPGSTSVTLNRVVGNDPSQLLGQMSANGQIFLVNPSGVYFGANARIDVAGLVATTFDIADVDFMAGRYQFARVDGRDPAQVINDGTITANGGYVVLAGDGVANHGLIEAYLGDIVMAAGERVGLDLGGDGLISFSIDGEALTEIAGVENTGELYADGGRVFLTAKVQGDLLPTAVNHEGLIQARTVEERDGIVYLGGAGGDVMIAGTIDADADTTNSDGGRILIASNKDITVSEGALLSAQGEGSGDGGIVRLIASDILDIEINAVVTTAGGEMGQGGFIEISGHQGLNVRGDVSPGSGGQVLIDPVTLVIAPGAAGSTASSVNYNASLDVTTVHEAYIEGELNSNIDVILVASNSIGVGSFGINSVIGATGSGDLSLRIGSTFVNSGSTGSLDTQFFEFGSGCGVGVCVDGGITGSFGFNSGANGNIDFKGGNGNYLGINIAGSVHFQPGANGVVDIESVQGGSVTIDGELRHVTTGSTSPANLSIQATSIAGSVVLNGLVLARNVTGGASVSIVGNEIHVSDTVAASGSDSVNPVSVSLNGSGGFTNSVEVVGGLLAQNTNGDASVDVQGTGITLSGIVRAAANGGDAGVNLNARSGVFNWTGREIIATDFIFAGTCSVAGPNCFTQESGFDSGSPINGLGLPSFTHGSGSATVSIAGGSVNLDTPFNSTFGSGFGAEGFIGAVAGGRAVVSIFATVGDLVLGSASNGGPFIGAEVGSAALSANAAGVSLNAGGMIDIYRTPTPIIEFGEARYYSVLANADGGRVAQTTLFGGSNISLNGQKTLVAAHVDGSGQSFAQATVSITANTANTDSISPNLVIEGEVEAIALGASSFNSAQVTITNNSGKTQIPGHIEALGGAAIVSVHGSCSLCSVDVSGELLAHNSPSANSGNAFVQVFGNGVQLSGVIEAHLHSGNSASANVFISAGGSGGTGDFVLANGGLIAVSDNGEFGSAAATSGGAVVLPALNPGIGEGSINIFGDDILLHDALGTVTFTEYSGSTSFQRTRLSGAIIADAGSANVSLHGSGFVDIGSASAVPLIASRGTDWARINITGDAGVAIRRQINPIFVEPGLSENVTLFSRALGSSASFSIANAEIDVDLGFSSSASGDLTLDSGALVHARAGDFVSSVALNSSAQAFVLFNGSIGAAININGDLLAEARGSSIDYAGIQLSTFGSGDQVNVAQGATLLAHGFAGTGSVTLRAPNVNISGTVISHGGRQGFAFMSHGGINGDIFVSSTGLVEARGDTSFASVHVSTTGISGSSAVTIDGSINAVAPVSARISLETNDLLQVRGSLLADATSFASVGVLAFGGTLDVGGNILSSANSANITISHGSSSGAINVSGNLTADGVFGGFISLFNSAAGAPTTIDSTASLQALGSPSLGAGFQLNTNGPLTIRDGAVIDVAGSINMWTGNGPVRIDGTLRSRDLGPFLFQAITLNGSGLLTVGSTGIIQAQGGTGSSSATILIGQSTAYAQFRNDGTIEATAGFNANVEIHAGGINIANGSRIIASGGSGNFGNIWLDGLGSSGVLASGLLDARHLTVTNAVGSIQVGNTQVLSATLINSGSGSIIFFAPGDLSLSQAVAQGGDITIDVGGTLNINGDITASGTGDVVLLAGADFGGDINLNATSIVGDFVVLDASVAGSITATSPSTIDANALTMLASDTIDLAFTSITTHNGIPPLSQSAYRAGDATMLTELANLGGNVPSSTIANTVFQAPTINLGNLDFFGEYLYMSADQLTLNAAIGTWLPGSELSPVVNPDVVVQMRPFLNTQAISIEDQPTPQVVGTTYYTNIGHFQQFPGTSLLVGGTTLGGAVTIGQNGSINIGGQNFLVSTTSTIVGGGNIITSGLSNLMAPPPPPPPPPPSPPPTTTTTTTPPPSEPVNTGVVNTVVQQATTTTDPTDPSGSAIPEETVQANVPPEEETGTEPTPDELPDIIAMLEQQPLIDGQVEVNNTVLTCQ